MNTNQALQSFEVQYLGAAMLAQSATGLGTLQKPLRDLYYAYQRPSGPVRLNPNLLTVSRRGLAVRQPQGEGPFGGDLFYAMPFIQFWDAVQFVAVREKDKRYKVAFEPLVFDHNRPHDNLFTALDYKKEKHLTKVPHPVLFAVVLRRTTGLKALDLHAFVCASDQQALALVNCLNSAHAGYSEKEDVYGQSPYVNGGVNYTGAIPPGMGAIHPGMAQPAVHMGSDPYLNHQPRYPLPPQQQQQAGLRPYAQNESASHGGGGHMADMWRLNQNNGSGGGLARSATNINGGYGVPHPPRGYELTQGDLIGSTGALTSANQPIYGNIRAARDPRLGVGPPAANISRSQTEVYQSRVELVNNASRMRQAQDMDIYGGQAGVSRSLEWSERQQPGLGRFSPVPFAQKDQGVHGQPAVQRQGLYETGLPQGAAPTENIYGRSVFNVGRIVNEPKREMNENVYGNIGHRQGAAPELSKSNDGHLHEIGGQRSNVVPSPAFGGGFSRPVEAHWEDAELPPRVKGTSPSYRRKFPAAADLHLGSHVDDARGAAQRVDPPAELLRPAFAQAPRQQNVVESPKPLPSVPYGRPAASLESTPALQSRPAPAAPAPVAAAPPQPRAPLPPSKEEEKLPSGARKSVFGIFPRDPAVTAKVAPASAPSTAEPISIQSTPLPAVPSASYTQAADELSGRGARPAGGAVGDKPVALVQPRKVQGIRVMPFGDELYGKLPVSKNEVKRSVDDLPARPLANERSAAADARSRAPPEDDDPDRPMKDREIAAAFGNLHFESSAMQQPQTNFEKSLGYLP